MRTATGVTTIVILFGLLTLLGCAPSGQAVPSAGSEPPVPTDQAILERALSSAEAALQEITTPMPTADQVKATLTAEGLTFVEAIGDPTTTVGFWAEVQTSGCLFGEIAPETGLTIAVGGFIADGGCHALSGH